MVERSAFPASGCSVRAVWRILRCGVSWQEEQSFGVPLGSSWWRSRRDASMLASQWERRQECQKRLFPILRRVANGFAKPAGMASPPAGSGAVCWLVNRKPGAAAWQASIRHRRASLQRKASLRSKPRPRYPGIVAPDNPARKQPWVRNSSVHLLWQSVRAAGSGGWRQSWHQRRRSRSRLFSLVGGQ
jgi:hypothetical protein